MATSVALLGSYVDVRTHTHNAIFTSVTNYADARILILLVAGCVMCVLLLAYCTGKLPACCARWDALSSRMDVSAHTHAHTFRPTYVQSKFGATLTAVAVVLAGALIGDVLIQFADEFWVERSWAQPAMDAFPRASTQGRVELYLTATRAPGQSTARCLLTGLATNAYILGSFQIAQASMEAQDPNDPFGTKCVFVLVHPTFQLAAPVYSPQASEVQPMLSLRFGPYLQLTSWSMRVFDAKAGAYSLGSPNDTALAFNETGGRDHAIATSLMPSHYTDKSYFSDTEGVLDIGYRASFKWYTLQPSSASTQLEDFATIVFEQAQWVSYTERTPRLSILQLLGIIFGLGAGILVLMKLVHEALDILFACVVLTPADALSCACCSARFHAKKHLLSTHSKLEQDGGGDSFTGVSMSGPMQPRPSSLHLIPYPAPAMSPAARPTSRRLAAADGSPARGSALAQHASMRGLRATALSPTPIGASKPADTNIDALDHAGWASNPIAEGLAALGIATGSNAPSSHDAAPTTTGFTGVQPNPPARPKPSGPGRKPLSAAPPAERAAPLSPSTSGRVVYSGKNPLKPAAHLPAPPPPPAGAATPSIGLGSTGAAGGGGSGVSSAIQQLRAQFEKHGAS